METPQKRQKSWFSSLTGLVSGGRSTIPQDASPARAATSASGFSLVNGDKTSTRVTSAQRIEPAPTRYSGTFSAPPDSPESPAKRASPTLLAQRRIHDRAQGPSGRLGAPLTDASRGASSNTRVYGGSLYSSSSLGRHSATPKRTNFSSATAPRNIFRDSVSRDMPAFTFTPRLPANTLRGSFPAATPGRSSRAPGIELTARDMAKVSSSDLFPMKIPDPDSKLSGEAITNMVPKELKGSKSLYANEYLAHLCPPDFNEEQRNQFFCILDLRRLKYAADEVFLKKDWRLNILNFAKEYEKNRSLIMLRYGLYEFKTVKVSKDTFQKWKVDNNIPDLDGEEDNADTIISPSNFLKSAPKSTSSAPKPNGTEGILRAGKRKAQDNIDPSAAASSPPAFQPSSKRSRPLEGARTEREPLVETSTPTLNKSKRKATRGDGEEQAQRAKMQKPTPSATPTATPSATKAFFEKVANSPAKDSSTTATPPSIHVSTPSDSGSVPTPSLFKSTTTANSSLARSVLESSLKANAAVKNNIFGYLSDASSAKGSGNDNADADGEDTDDSEVREDSEAPASDNQSAAASAIVSTPQPASSLFATKATSSLAPPALPAQLASSSSSDASDSAPSRSLFDRVNKGSDGQPIRMLGSEGAASPFKSNGTALFGSKPTSERASPEKEAPLPAANKTWNPDTPIKFAGGPTSGAAKPLFGGATTTTPAAAPALFSFGASSSIANKAPSGSDKSGTAPAPTASRETVPAAPGATPAPQATPAPLFGFLNKPAETSSTATAPLFGTPDTQSSAPAASAVSASAISSAPSASSLFGKPPSTTSAPAAVSAPAASSLFGKPPSSIPAPAVSLFGASATTPAPSSQPSFGSVPESDTASFGTKRSAEDDFAPKAAGISLFGNAPKRNEPSGGNEPQAKRTMFGGGAGNSAAPASSAPLFSFGAPKPNGTTGKPTDSATAKPQESTPLFGNSNGLGSTVAAQTTQPGSLFASTPATAPASSGPIFSFGAGASAPSFGAGSNAGSAGSSFTFNAGGAGGSQSFRNPFASGDAANTAPTTTSFNFGAETTNGQSATTGSSLFQFGGGSTAAPSASASGPAPLFTFGGGSQSSTQATEAATPNSSFGNTALATNGLGSSAIFSFGAGAPSQPAGTPLFGQKPDAGTSLFNLAPPMGGVSSGTSELMNPMATFPHASWQSRKEREREEMRKRKKEKKR